MTISLSVHFFEGTPCIGRCYSLWFCSSYDCDNNLPFHYLVAVLNSKPYFKQEEFNFPDLKSIVGDELCMFCGLSILLRNLILTNRYIPTCLLFIDTP